MHIILRHKKNIRSKIESIVDLVHATVILMKILAMTS